MSLPAAVLLLALVLGTAPARAEYRPFDGRGTSTRDSAWAATLTAFQRDLPDAYQDGVSAPPVGRPNPRVVSNALFGQGPFDYNKLQFSTMHAAWGQLVAHDVAKTFAATPAEDMDIAVPCGDARLDPQGTCNATHPFTRNAYDPASSPRQQLNAQSGYLDGSVVYGADQARMQLLRTWRDGLMLSDELAGVPQNPSGHFQDGPVAANLQRLTGDGRGNVNPGLLALHGLLVLEHNRKAHQLAVANPLWSDEQLFQEARRHVMAVVQHITYTGKPCFLPVSRLRVARC